MEDQKLALTFDRTTGSWQSEGQAHMVFIDPSRKEIISLLKEEGKPMVPKDISAKLEKNYDTTRGLLRKMVKDNQLTQMGRGQYYINSVNIETSETL
ncbi:MAG: hypothetical protein J7K90_12090 [Desulfuromusa sp.]|nr:hypothetical protein [Desulfuromusa sp.]